MTDETEAVDTGAAADALADEGLDIPDTDAVVEDTSEPYVEPEPQPEPTIVGHQVIQDNVSEPGVESTHTVVDGEHHVSSATTLPPLDEPEDDEALDTDA